MSTAGAVYAHHDTPSTAIISATGAYTEDVTSAVLVECPAGRHRQWVHQGRHDVLDSRRVATSGGGGVSDHTVGFVRVRSVGGGDRGDEVGIRQLLQSSRGECLPVVATAAV